VTSEKETPAVIDLQKLAESNLREVDTDTLRQAVHDTEQVLEYGQDWSGLFIAELHRRSGLSWPAFAKQMGMPRTTLLRRAQPYLDANPKDVEQ
jgi:DNA-binding transcriptional regulator YiaG